MKYRSREPIEFFHVGVTLYCNSIDRFSALGNLIVNSLYHWATKHGVQHDR